MGCSPIQWSSKASTSRGRHTDHLDEALRLAERGVALDDREANAVFAWGGSQLLAAASTAGDRTRSRPALELNPCHACRIAGWGIRSPSDRRAEAAIPCYELRARRSSPQTVRGPSCRTARSRTCPSATTRRGSLGPQSDAGAQRALLVAARSLTPLAGPVLGDHAQRANVPAAMRSRPGFSASSRARGRSSCVTPGIRPCF